MDPDEALRMIRASLSARERLAYGDSNDDEIEAGRELAEQVTELDGWLSNGGFLPADWQQRPAMHTHPMTWEQAIGLSVYRVDTQKLHARDLHYGGWLSYERISVTFSGGRVLTFSSNGDIELDTGTIHAPGTLVGGCDACTQQADP